MNLYIDIDGQYWAGTVEDGVIFLNDEAFSVGAPYTAEVWGYETVLKTWGIREVN